MATILLSAAGAAIGSGFGGTVLGLSGAVIGRAIGATVGRAIDQRLLGLGSEPVETGRVDQFRLTAATDGAAVAEVWGRVRVGGQVIWSTRFQEIQTTTSGGKGSPQPATTSFSYTVSLAIALCKGEILGVGRIWADGMEIAPESLNLRVYAGSEDQMPDAKIEAVEGAGLAPAYRGIAYVVIEDLDMGRFGNRVPQMSFEVIRQAQGQTANPILDIADSVRGVALIPGTGEYGLATTALHVTTGPGVSQSVNVNSPSGLTDFATSLDQLQRELPNVGATSLVVSWFGSDLRCGSCLVQPKVEPTALDAEGMVWTVSGLTRSGAQPMPELDGRAVYGGTPTDQAVVEAIQALRASGKDVMFYPFLLMDQVAGNGLPDPWGNTEQPALPWRGRITTSKAPGIVGTPDRMATAEAEVAAFMGTALASHFSVVGQSVLYSGPTEWRFRRMILHYANLCVAAGGVESFIIGSELRSLTQVRGAADSFPMVAALRQLAAEVKQILPSAKVGYAADWSEYFGYNADGNVYFHLDPLWADSHIDFVGIDNYMPVSDWRNTAEQADASWGSIYNVDYLKANIAGGEGFDWYYDSPEAVSYQTRTAITDGAYAEPWIFRYKDLKNWWGRAHYNRLSGLRQTTPTAWVAQSKPIRFTEYGCPAIDKASNQPNLFLDPKSSESALPRDSTGRRDDFIQMQYLRAMREFWTDGANNPTSLTYAAPMVDFDHSYVWAWDCRPFPEFPGNSDQWGDAANYQTGHWLNGRASSQPLAGVIAELCGESGVQALDLDGVFGTVRGFSLDRPGPVRSALQVLSMAYGFDPVEREGALEFRTRDGQANAVLDPEFLVYRGQDESNFSATRQSNVELVGRVRLGFFEAENDFDVRTAEADFPDDSASLVTQSDLALVLTKPEARAIAERWLAESRVARDIATFALPPSQMGLSAGDVVEILGERFRIDRIEQTEAMAVDAVRVDPGSYVPGPDVDEPITRSSAASALPVYPVFLDLPLMTGDEVVQAPHVAVTASPWPGTVGVWSAPTDDGYALNVAVADRAVIGVTQTAMTAAPSGIFDRGAPLRVLISAGQLSSASEEALLSGMNLAAIGDGTPENWELFQFATATLVAPGLYELGTRLRGQAGTDGVMPAVWPVGSLVVMIDRSVGQIGLASSLRGVSQSYRVGAEANGYADSKTLQRVLAFQGIGLRPYSVTDLDATGSAGSMVSATWIRRTRIDGDSWDTPEVPLSEASEVYAVRVYQGSTIRREETTTTPNWTYAAATQTSDGVTGSFDIAVAQVSDRFGPGPFVRVSVA